MDVPRFPGSGKSDLIPLGLFVTFLSPQSLQRILFARFTGETAKPRTSRENRAKALPWRELLVLETAYNVLFCCCSWSCMHSQSCGG